MFADAAQFLLRTAFDLLACAFFMRFWMQAARVPFRNPFAQFVIKVTDFAVRPLRRMLPGLFGLDWASLVLFFLAELLMVLGTAWIMGYPFAIAGGAVLPGFLLMALASCLRLGLYVLMGFILIQAVLCGGTIPPRPAMVHDVHGGAAIDVEVWELTPAAFGDFVSKIPAPLGIGKVTLAGGEEVPGFVAEPRSIDGAEEITSFGGWRAWLNRACPA